MGIAERVKANYIARIEELVAMGSAMPMEKHSRQTSYNFLSGESMYRQYDLARRSDFVEWRTSCIAVLDQVIPKTSLLRKTVDSLNTLSNEPSKIEFVVGFLRSVKKELEAGSLDSLVRQIEAEVLSDYLDLATNMLTGSKDEPSHIAAAVIASASLERTLRTMCRTLSPEEPVTNDKGAPLGMTSLIDALKKRQVFNELQAKELRAWATLRNYAAHGDFDQFNRQQVESMVSGIERFVTEHSK